MPPILKSPNNAMFHIYAVFIYFQRRRKGQIVTVESNIPELSNKAVEGIMCTSNLSLYNKLLSSQHIS